MKYLLTFLSVIFTGIIPVLANAATTNYTPLAELPVVAPSSGTNIAIYLSNLPLFIISLAAVLAVIMIIIGGVQYVSTDALSGKKNGKERIKNAVTGLILAIASYAILYTISPNIVGGLNLDLGLNKSNISINGYKAPLNSKNPNDWEALEKKNETIVEKKEEVLLYNSGKVCYKYESGVETDSGFFGFWSKTAAPVLMCSDTREKCVESYKNATKPVPGVPQKKIIFPCTNFSEINPNEL